MSKISVDIEKLTYGLEKGIGKTRTPFASIEREQRLRITACGLVSSAIHAYALREGIPSRLVISNPNLPFDPEMQHVVPLLGESEDNPTAVDASPSQFFTYVGLILAYERATGETLFPPEKILSFELAERQLIVEWLTGAAVRFQKINRRPKGKYGFELGDGPLADSSETTIRAAYAKIWDPANFSSWTPITRVQQDGAVASRPIPKETIIMS